MYKSNQSFLKSFSIFPDIILSLFIYFYCVNSGRSPVHLFVPPPLLVVASWKSWLILADRFSLFPFSVSFFIVLLFDCLTITCPLFISFLNLFSSFRFYCCCYLLIASSVSHILPLIFYLNFFILIHSLRSPTPQSRTGSSMRS